MDHFWHNIDDVQFEQIAIDYANSILPEWKWKGTKQTRDGGKDGTAVIFDQRTKIGQIKKEAWVEAKYTKNYKHALPLSRIASTVLIGHNKRDLVEILLIVTNASFSESTTHEIYLLLGNHVFFVTGVELQLWLQDDNQAWIRDKYSLHGQYHCRNEVFSLIGKPLIIKQDLLCRSVSTRSEQLIVGNKYTLFLTLNVSIPSIKELTFKIANYSDYIIIHGDFLIKTRWGTNFISISFTASKPGKITEKQNFITLKEVNSLAQIEIRHNLTIKCNPRIEVLCKSQSECEAELLQSYNLFCNREKGLFFNLIEGPAGNGKSHVLTDFIQAKYDDEYIFIKFNHDNELTNSILLIRLLTFIVWGRFFAENILNDDDPEKIDEEIRNLHKISGYNESYTKYLRYMADDDNALEIVNKLARENDLIPPTLSRDSEKIVILDDLQFLGNQTSRLLLHILGQKNLEDYKIFCVLAKRDKELSYKPLDEFVQTCSSQRSFTVGISTDDVYHSLQIHKLDSFPFRVLSQLKRNFFILKEFIAIAKALNEEHPILILRNEEIKRLLAQQQQIPFTYSKFSKEKKQIIDIVYFFKSGVSASYLYDKYSDKAIDDLIYRDIIKNTSTGYVPFHDLLWESVSKIIKYDSDHIYDYAMYKQKNGDIIAYFSVLGFFPSKFDRNKTLFISTLSRLHYEQKYASVYYILHRFFSIRNYECILYDRYYLALLLFYYAYSIFNVGNRNGLDIFEQAYGKLSVPDLSEQEKNLSNLILSEIANCHYWELNFDSIIQKYKIINGYFQQKKEKIKEDWIAYFTITTRYISSLFFRDKDDKAIEVYKTTIAQVPNSDIKRLAIYVVDSFNRINFINDEQGSYENIRMLIADYFDSMPVKNKFVIRSSFLFMGILLGYNNISELEEWIEWGKTHFLEYNYRVTQLDLAICYALKGEYEKVEQTIHSVIDIRDFPILARGKYHNLEALVYLHHGEYMSALRCLGAQEKCYVKLGQSYKDNIQKNERLIKSMPERFDIGYKPAQTPTFYIDIRL